MKLENLPIDLNPKESSVLYFQPYAEISVQYKSKSTIQSLVEISYEWESVYIEKSNLTSKL